MKRLTIVVCLLISGLLSSAQSLDDLSFGTDSTFEVVTWNIQWFPKSGQRTVDYVKQIIEALDVDLLAIQEIDDINAFEGLIDSLDGYEGYLESSWFAGLAYIYKTAVIQINDIYEIYTTSPYWSPFPRSPMVMDLNFMNERIFVINNHFKCCGDGIFDIENPDDEESRRYIASNLLKEHIDNFLPDKNTIVLGDLNDILSDDSVNNVFRMILDDEENYRFVDYDIAYGPVTEWSYPSWPSHLDHILITKELFDAFEHSTSLVQTIKIEKYLPDGWWDYDNYISDHRPVAMKLMMNPVLTAIELTESSPLFKNYPNPFDFETRFSFDISDGNREIQIFNITGQLVFSGKIPRGENSFVWIVDSLPAGVYIAKLLLDNKAHASLKLILR